MPSARFPKARRARKSQKPGDGAGEPPERAAGDDEPVDEPTTPAPELVTHSTVDKRALADNLFGAGEYKLAVEIYQEMLGNKPSLEEETWYRYQMATAYRHLGNVERSATYYREVVSAETNEFLAENAKWWLSVLEQRQSTDARLSNLSSALAQVRDVVESKR